jgi:hypothetical protein
MAADKKPLQTEQIPLSDGQILKLLPIGWTGSAAHILQLARAVEAQHGITAKEGDQK